MRTVNALGGLLIGLLACSAVARAQIQGSPIQEIQTSGTSYFIYAEPGAPTLEVRVAGEGVRNGIYKVQEGTSLTDLMVLSGGVPTSADTERQIVRALVRVLREENGRRVPIYEATTEEAIREPGAHPALRDEDVLELDLTYEELGEPVTFWRVMEVAGRVASLVSVFLIIYTRADRL